MRDRYEKHKTSRDREDVHLRVCPSATYCKTEARSLQSQRRDIAKERHGPWNLAGDLIPMSRKPHHIESAVFHDGTSYDNLPEGQSAGSGCTIESSSAHSTRYSPNGRRARTMKAELGARGMKHQGQCVGSGPFPGFSNCHLLLYRSRLSTITIRTRQAEASGLGPRLRLG